MSRVDVLINLIKQHDYKTYIEVGVKRGRMLTEVVNATGVKAIGVDAWRNIPNTGESYDEWDFEDIKASYDKNVAPFGDRISTLHMTSLMAAVRKDTICDIVFIDAGHDYMSAWYDITAWRQRATGIISGHDYDERFPGVIQAVDELVPNRRLEDNAVWWAYA